LYGAKEDDIVGKTDYDFVDKELADSFRTNDKKAMTANKPTINEEQITYIDDGHTEIVETIKTPMHDSQGKLIGVLGIARDITERKLAEKEREKLIAELEARNTELTQFTYTVSHDLKSPLVTINGYLNYLEQDAASGNMERLKNDTRRIQEAAEKMHTLLTELLELSRIGRMMNEPVDVPFDDLVKEVLDIAHGQIEKNNVTVQFQSNLPVVHGDRQRLIQVLQNLIDNATRHVANQSAPLIEIGHQGHEDSKPIFFIRTFAWLENRVLYKHDYKTAIC
jgi:PAS domain S-box-containing protein